MSAYQLKIIALICMTIDHIGAYGFEIPIIGQYYSFFRSIGRLAAPIFLFVLCESIRHTKSKKHFLLRLYLTGVAVGIFFTIFNLLFGSQVGYYTYSNTLFTFMYVVLFVQCLETAKLTVRKRDLHHCKNLAFLLLLLTLPSLMYSLSIQCVSTNMPSEYRLLLHSAILSIFPSVLHIDYGFTFVILGALIYFAKTKKKQCATLGLFCCVCIIGANIARQNPELYVGSSFASTFFDFRQCLMIFSLIPIALYNGTKGRGGKIAFYLYYPIHQVVITFISSLI